MKKLYKSRKEKMFAGVCGGIAEYFDVDPVLVRILFVIFTFMGGSGFLAYIIGMIVMPFPPTEDASAAAESSPPPPSTSSYSTHTDSGNTYQSQPTPSTSASANSKGALIFGVILVLLGAYFLMRNIPMFHHWYWWIRWNISDYFIPGIFIIIGVILIGNSRKNKEDHT